ncbi:DUF2806 domain-containing protein [Serratia nevei]|uniref:DUF2806 domain-containing protein n=1 Tax=Serratia nevei TaxID=2703794 RepID=UPI003FA72560
MVFPGENLAIKLWETLADKPIAAFLKPKQILREGLAVNITKRDEMLMLAQAEVDAEKIKSGEMVLVRNGGEIKVISSRLNDSNEIEPRIDLPYLFTMMEAEVMTDKIKGDINVSRAVFKAEEILLNSEAPTPDKSIDDDWLVRWRDNASKTSNEDVQMLWAQVLAGELKSPGDFSLRTLNFINTINQHEASLIERIAAHVVNYELIFKVSSKGSPLGESISYPDLLYLEELGIIYGTGGTLTYTATIPPCSEHKPIFTCNDKIITTINPLGEKKISINVLYLTRLGREVVKLSVVKAEVNSFVSLAKEMKRFGVNVFLWDYDKSGGCIKNGVNI